MYCNKCGTVLADNATNCEKCGHQLGGGKSAISYDYITVQTEGKSAYEIIDSYQSLGWEVAGKKHSVIPGLMSIDFRRDRKIKNKEQLNRVQVRLDDAINSIKVLEKNKTGSAMVIALILGVIGALIFGGGMSMFLTIPNPELWVYIVGGIFAAVGAVPCSLAYFVFSKIRTKKTAAMNVLIEQKRDEISDLCEDAQKFLD